MTLYLLSGPQTNRVGLFHLSIGAATEDIGGTMQAVRNCVRRVCDAFTWHFDAVASVIWIPSWWEFNTVKGNIQNFQGALSDLHELPTTPLLAEFCKNTSPLPREAWPLLEPWALLGQRSGSGRTQEQERRQDKQEQETVSSAASAEPAVLEFPTVGLHGVVWGLTKTQITEWQALFPSLDVLAEARAALAWVQANPGRRKTSKGMLRFLVGWLTRSCDRGNRNGQQPAMANKNPEWNRLTPFEQARQLGLKK